MLVKSPLTWLGVATSAAVAWVSPWLVPLYWLLMAAILLLPSGSRRGSSTRSRSDGSESTELGMLPDSEDPNVSEGGAVEDPDTAPAQEPDPSQPQAATDSESVESNPPKAKRGRGRGKKAARTSALDLPRVTWVRVGPGKFVRMETSHEPAESEPSLWDQIEADSLPFPPPETFPPPDSHVPVVEDGGLPVPDLIGPERSALDVAEVPNPVGEKGLDEDVSEGRHDPPSTDSTVSEEPPPDPDASCEAPEPLGLTAKPIPESTQASAMRPVWEERAPIVTAIDVEIPRAVRTDLDGPSEDLDQPGVIAELTSGPTEASLIPPDSEECCTPIAPAVDVKILRTAQDTDITVEVSVDSTASDSPIESAFLAVSDVEEAVVPGASSVVASEGSVPQASDRPVEAQELTSDTAASASVDAPGKAGSGRRTVRPHHRPSIASAILPLVSVRPSHRQPADRKTRWGRANARPAPKPRAPARRNARRPRRGTRYPPARAPPAFASNHASLTCPDGAPLPSSRLRAGPRPLHTLAVCSTSFHFLDPLTPPDRHPMPRR